MKTVTMNLYEFDDLSDEIKAKVRRRITEEVIEGRLCDLQIDLDNGDIDEDDYYCRLNCSKEYAETTSWFVPAAFYEEENNKFLVDEEVDEILKDALFVNDSGRKWQGD